MMKKSIDLCPKFSSIIPQIDKGNSYDEKLMLLIGPDKHNYRLQGLCHASIRPDSP